MNIVFFSNPDFFGTQKRPLFSSMPRFTHMLADGMTQRGHNVSIWSPGSKFFRFPVRGVLKKWMGYIDQYVMFPADVRQRLRECPDDTLFVFTDQAQGPWIPLVQDKRHVMHCHDFLAQWSALGQINEHKTGWTGKKYQHFIRNGYTKGKNFISGSYKTSFDLQKLVDAKKISLNVVYNGLDKLYCPMNSSKARSVFGNKIGMDLSAGYLLHVGGNQWYKNREGVIEIYNSWRSLFNLALPLILVGAEPSPRISKLVEDSPYSEDIHLISGLADLYVRYAYAGATVFIFPSLAEGFGWPIAEAMGTGCPVITTNEAPMTEVAGNAGFLLPRRTPETAEAWADQGAQLVQKIVSLSENERKEVVLNSLNNVKRFDIRKALDQIEGIYTNIMSTT